MADLTPVVRVDSNILAQCHPDICPEPGWLEVACVAAIGLVNSAKGSLPAGIVTLQMDEEDVPFAVCLNTPQPGHYFVGIGFDRVKPTEWTARA